MHGVTSWRVLMHGVISTAPHRYFFASPLKGFQKAFISWQKSWQLLFGAQCSCSHRLHGWIMDYCLTFALYPVPFILHRNYAMWSESATKRSQLSISSAANLLISVCKNFSKIVVEVFNSGQRMVKTVLVHILHPSSPLRLMMEWIATIQKILIPL